MNRKKRFLTAVTNGQPDRVPLFGFLSQKPSYKALIGREPEGYNARDAVECALALNHDGIPAENIVEMFRVGTEYGGGFYD